jgi:hypothetical protein
MGIRYLKKYAALEGQVSAEDAEALTLWLRGHKAPAVRMAKCEHVHAAVLQVLLALAPRVVTPPAEPWLAAAIGSRALRSQA